jgi:hypothetical protein
VTLRFTIRDVLWLMVVVAVVLVAGWINFWLEYQNFHLRVQDRGQQKIIDQLTEENERLRGLKPGDDTATLNRP